jgi:sugar diacid utilization regulator
VRVTDGTRHSALGTMVLNYGEGVGGFVALNRVPLLVDNYPKDPRPKPPGVAYLAATEDILSIISVPMVTRSGLVGVLFAASRQEAVFNPSQMGLLAALGTQAAIAIENARLYENEKATAKKLLAATSTAQELLRLVLDNLGLPAIADTLSNLVHAPVLVEDDRHRVVCVSSAGVIGPDGHPLTNLTFATTDLWHDAEYREAVHILQTVRHAIHIPARPDRKIYYPRTIAPVVAGVNILGYVSVLELDTFNEQQYSAVDQASIILALEFLKVEIAQDVEARLAGDLLDDLIQARAGNDPTLLQRAARLNVDLRQPHRILVLDIDQFAQAVRRHRWTDMDALAIKRRFLSTVSDIAKRDFNGALTGTRSDSVLVLLPVKEPDSLKQAEAQACTLQAALPEALSDLTVSVGIGRAAEEPGQLPRSYEDAMLALRTASQFGGHARAVAYENLGVVPLLLQSQNQKELLAFMDRHLGPLVRYDTANQSQLVETLESYLAKNGNLRLAADECHIHLNSLKYRLRRIHEISGLDLRDGDMRFHAQLALAIHRAVGLVTE